MRKTKSISSSFQLIFLIWVGLSLSCEKKTATVSEYRIFRSCYTLLTGKSLQIDSPYLQRLKQGQTSGAELCQELLSDVQLDEKGFAKNENAKNILARMQLVHLSWFNRMSIMNSEKEYATSSVIDVQAPANYLSWTLFSGKNANKLFLVNEPPAPLRYVEVPQKFILEKEINVAGLNAHDLKPWLFLFHAVDHKEPMMGYDPKKEKVWQPDYVTLGDLIGFSSKTEMRKPTSDVFAIPKESFGGGILGTQAYFSINTGVEFDVLTDGAVKMHRRWSENIFKDFLCRDLPVLDEMDVISHVNLKSEVSFQKNPVCMKCHHTMDNLAAGARNLYITWTGFTVTEPFVSKIVRKVDVRDPHHKGLVRSSADKEYSFTQPHGQLNYRNIDGQLVSYNFKELNELGKHLAQSKDFHYCLSKRYIKYFTGYDFDVLVKGSESTEAKEFIKISENFYSHKNQKHLIQDILGSPLFTQAVR